MNLKEVHTKNDFCDFYNISATIYQSNAFHRDSESDITRLLVEGHSAFHKHATVHSYLIMHGEDIAGRFSLIHDEKLPEYVQVSFFEALPDLTGLADLIAKKAAEVFPLCKKMICGLNGHLNYGAGILASHFDEPPVFGLPYTMEYYQDYFAAFRKISLISFRFPFKPFVDYRLSMGDHPDFNGITVRKLNKRKLWEDIEVYTQLNNACFMNHPLWAERTAQEDFELFHPFRFLIREEHLLFAEKDGKPIGFFLWYPDFNQILKENEQLGIKHILKYYFTSRIDTFRFTEIAVLPGYQMSYAVLAMFWHAIPYMQKAGFNYGEGGFIFEENTNSIAMTRRFIERASGIRMEPYRHYALYETDL